MFEHVAAAEQAGRVTYYDLDDAETGLRHRFRFVRAVPLNEAHADLRVNFLECCEWDKDTVQHFSCQDLAPTTHLSPPKSEAKPC